ncbi:MAG: alpha-2-macroglobulin family protein, partial [Pseudomonadota bacterium]
MTAARDLDLRIETAINRVLANQSRSGAFGLWRPDRGDLWLDAYVTDFLSRARSKGHAVPDTAFEQAIDNLLNAVSYSTDFVDAGEDIAYALLVLAREGKASIGDLRYYADAKAADFATPMAKAQLGAALAMYGEQSRADIMMRLARDQALALTDEQLNWRYDYGSHLRDAAAVLALANEAGSDVGKDRSLIRAVADRAGRETWTSTQEKVWMLMATATSLSATSTGITVNGAPATSPVINLTDAQAMAGQSLVIANGDAPIDAVLTTFGVPTEPAAAGGAGYGIERTYYTMDGEAVSPDTVAQNSRLAVVLTISVDRDENGRLMVNDPLPAGFEIDNPNLLRSGSVKALDWIDAVDVMNAEFRTDRFMAAVDWGKRGMFRLAYIVRAVSPGTFHHPAATVEDMYRPYHRAWTDTGRITVVAEDR